MIYVYAILAEAVQPTAAAGMDDATVELRAVDGVVVAASEHAEGVPDPSDAAVLRHAEVVERLADTTDAILPARFGLVFEDGAALERAVAASAADLAEALERVRGCVEIGLRVLAPRRAEPAATRGGGDYMRARLREVTERDTLATEVHARLDGIARASASQAPPDGDLLLNAAYLVPRGSVAEFEAAVEETEAVRPELALLCTGPWPPYSFAPTAETGT